jgi:alkylation response protein AidB-like acyl-CoA dehydrogenase
MNLHLTDEQQMLRETLSRLFAVESTPERIRAAEARGFDPKLWSALVESGVPAMRIPESSGGGGNSLLDALLAVEEAGRHLATVPLAEALVAGRLLAQIGDAARPWLERVLAGAPITLALLPALADQPQIVAGGADAEMILVLDGDAIVLIELGDIETVANLGSSSLCRLMLTGSTAAGERHRLIAGASAGEMFQAAVEEWKLLTAAMLVGLARQSLEMAAAYSRERQAFGRAIGSYQGIAHPLADAITEVEGAQLLVWRAAWAIGLGRSDGAALISMAYWWATQCTARAVARALHTYGGYGVSSEYDIQLYYRRGKARALLAGDPRRELRRVAERLWGKTVPVSLPDAGDMPLEMSWGEAASAFARKTREYFNTSLTPELRAHAHHSVDGFDPAFNRQLASAGFLFPHWSVEHGGQGRSLYEFWAMISVIESFGWEHVTSSITNSVAQLVMRFATPAVKEKVLGEFARGESLGCLGFTEPSCGSDLFAIKTRADRDGSGWVINGQKIFTTSANLAHYCFLLARTDPAKPKHAGITIFLVPMSAPGIEIQAVHTLQDERTNIVFLTDVKVADEYRIGEIDGGMHVMAAMLEIEHGSGDHYRQGHETMIRRAIEWAQHAQRDGAPLLADSDAACRLASAVVHLEVSTMLCRRAIWALAEGITHRYWGPMAKLFATEFYQRDATDLMDLAAPVTLLSDRHGHGVAQIEIGYRQSIGTTIYGGTSEVQRSLVAEQALGMPKSRS